MTLGICGVTLFEGPTDRETLKGCRQIEAHLGVRIAHSLTQHKPRQLKPGHGQGNRHGPAVEPSNSASIAQSKQWKRQLAA